MKRKIILFLLLFIPITVKATPINPNFEDDILYSCVIDAYNEQNSSNKTTSDNLSDSELQTITNLDCSVEDITLNFINSTKGIEKLTNLTTLNLSNREVTLIDLSNNTKLTELILNANNISEINLEHNSLLNKLELKSNELNDINLEKNINLTDLELSFNHIKSLDLSKNIKLANIYISFNPLENININECTQLKILQLAFDNLSQIDLSHNQELTNLNLTNNKIESLDLTNNINLDYLILTTNQLNKIDLSKNTKLTNLQLANNNIESLDLTNNQQLKYLIINHNNLLNLNLKNNPELVKSILELDQNDTIISPQEKTVPVIKKDNIYTLNIKDLNQNIDLQKIIIVEDDNISYDSNKGIVTFKQLPEEFSYNYNTDATSTKIDPNMTVNLNFTIIEDNSSTPSEDNPNIENNINNTIDTNSDVDIEENLPENPQTGQSLPIIILLIMGTTGITLLIKNKSILFR